MIKQSPTHTTSFNAFNVTSSHAKRCAHAPQSLTCTSSSFQGSVQAYSADIDQCTVEIHGFREDGSHLVPGTWARADDNLRNGSWCDSRP